jgi:serine/threonine-protein kinase
MKLVKGRTLAALLAERSGPGDSLPGLLAIFLQVAQTLAYAHARGLIHRDLKPSNVMVGSFGEVQVMDWGVAKVLRRGGTADDETAGKLSDHETVIATARSGSDADRSLAGSVMGTPAYMAPEQARGEIDRLDERCDVFALGSMLCEILTGMPAFCGHGSAEIQRLAARGDTADARARLEACGGDAELIALARDCLATDPDDRPRDAAEVSDRLSSHLASLQERTRRAELARAEAQARAAEERKRRKLAVTMGVAIAALIALVGAVSSWLVYQQQARATRVELAVRDAEVLKGRAEATGDDLALWAAARESAHNAARQVDDARDAATRVRAADIAADVDRLAGEAEADRKLLDELAEIRTSWSEDYRSARTDARYAAAFRARTLDPFERPPEVVGRLVTRRPPRVAAALATYLDQWAILRWVHRKDRAGAARLVAAARTAASDPWRDRLRAAVAELDREPRMRTLQDLANSAPPDLSPGSLYLLGQVLLWDGDAKAAAAVLEVGQIRNPGDVWINFSLARALTESGRREEGIRYYEAARVLLPETAHDLAHALEAVWELDRADAVLRDLVRRYPDNGRHLGCLGLALQKGGRSKEADVVLSKAVTLLRDTIRRTPGDANAHSYLAKALSNRNDPDEAILEYREAIRLDPAYYGYHVGLGVALHAKGEIDVAIVEDRTAIRLGREESGPHVNLGRHLHDKGDVPGAIAEFREAIRLDPASFLAHDNLGIVLGKSGQLDEAEAELREAIRLSHGRSDMAHHDLGALQYRRGRAQAAVFEFRSAVRIRPDRGDHHMNLAVALNKVGDLTGTIAEFREAVLRDPGEAQPHNDLGVALTEVGEIDAADAAVREALRLKSQEPARLDSRAAILRAGGCLDEALAEFREADRLTGHRHPVIRADLAHAENLVAVASHLPAVMGGQPPPADAAERANLAEVCLVKGLPALAARLYRDAFRDRPALAEGLADGRRLRAARAAALAGTGRGGDVPPLDRADRALWRKQALDWLRDDLAACSKALDGGEAPRRFEALKALNLAKLQRDVAGLRGEASPSELSDQERKDWRSLWGEVERLLAKASLALP